MGHFTARQNVFVEAFIQTGNATESARRAGYSAHTANSNASRLLKQPHIRDRIEQSIGAALRVKATSGSSQSGYVYVIRADNGLVKIGKSRDAKRRISKLNQIMPYDLEIIYTFRHDQYSDLEAFLHLYFAEFRVRGEWFSLDADQIALIPDVVNSTPNQLRLIF